MTAELGGVAAIACYAMEARNMRRTVIAGTTTRAERAGASIRLTQRRGEDTVASWRGPQGCSSSGRGGSPPCGKRPRRVRPRSERSQRRPSPEGRLQEREPYRLPGDKLLAVAPDLICSMDGKGNPLTNADLQEGMEITYIGFAAAPAFRTPQVCAMFAEALAAADYHDGFVQVEKLAQ